MTMCKGTVFDIKRFATHDGHGIRTTVFLKGCPLRCVWCQNPEGLNPKPQIIYLENNCIHCGSCVKASTNKGIEIVNNELKIHRNIQEDWNQIVDVCPTRAIRFDSRVYSIEEIIKEAEKDQAFFKYGGGVTISGGEPFYQIEFLEELLKALKEKRIHTAIETTLFTKKENIERVLPYLNQIYCDCKLFDENLHKKYTSVSNQMILSNIEYILKSDKKESVIVRTPLIPEMTATKENIKKISQFLVSCYDEVKYELLNYNPLAKAKYSYLGMKYCFEENPKLYTKDKMEEFYQIAKDNGIRNLIIE